MVVLGGCIKGMLTPLEIKTFIDNDRTSDKKRQARIGLNYYEGIHDIKDYRIFYIDANGELQEDKTKSNIKITHPFFSELVDQEVQYMLSGQDGFVKSDNTKLKPLLDEYFNENENFISELYEVLTDCVVKGFAYAYAYRGEDGKTCFQCADSLGVVEVRAKETEDKCDYVIFHYIDRVGKDNKKIKRIQVWSEKETHYFCQVDDGAIVPDESVPLNPRPHIVFTKPNDPATYYEDYGMIPFFRVDNCKKQFSGLRPIKDLIDDYDLMAAGLSNNIQDTNESLYVVKGFSGDNLDELMVNIKAKKHIGVEPGGDVEIRTIDIPYQARQTKLELDEKSIYRFGFGLNTAALKDTAATTNIAIKAAYSLLDLKCNKLEIRLKQFMRQLLKIVLKEINDANGTDFQQKDVYFDFRREVPSNAQENAQIELTDAQRQQVQINTLLNLGTHLDNETLMKQVFEVLDLNYEDYKDKLPKPDENDPYTAEKLLKAPEGVVNEAV